MRTALSVILAFFLLAGAGALAILGLGGSETDPVFLALVAILAVVAGIGVLVKVAGSTGEDDDVAAAPWSEDGALVDRSPERSPADEALSGDDLAEVIEAAGEAARDDGTVAAGVAHIRPALRRTLEEVLVQGGTQRGDASDIIDRGAWTDDKTAAAVLSPSVSRPKWSLLQRVRAWLFPEQIVRSEVQRAVQAIADVSDSRLPLVPGRRAPRTVPTLQPRLEDLQRGADGRLQRAADPLAIDPTPGDRGYAEVEPAEDEVDDAPARANGDEQSGDVAAESTDTDRSRDDWGGGWGTGSPDDETGGEPR